MTFTPPVPVPRTSDKPKWLSLSAIGVVIVAFLNVLGGLSAPLTLLMSKHHPYTAFAGSSPEFAAMIALQRKMMAPPAPLLLGIAGVACLLAGAWALWIGARLLTDKRGLRVPFRRSIVALGAVDAAHAAIGVWLQTRNRELLGEYMSTLTRSTAAPPGFEHWMQLFVQGGVVLGLVVAVVMGVGKLVVLALAYRYAGTPSVAAYLDR